ncbi:hypothetical protein AAW31_06965 [Nitrosomonas communis]|uniref:Uncharacterized protein n=1 Tax=Nitrosomonas communis TaxID=44574 RepID=A0A0F7KFF6_9PROT|nr:hypothetical protein [Nitrosomonas sp. PLL12-2]AKH37614.1 hypothetical protein AAW31_06965 [Nitrosomonas communis]
MNRSAKLVQNLWLPVLAESVLIRVQTHRLPDSGAEHKPHNLEIVETNRINGDLRTYKCF